MRKETECNGNDSLTCGVVPVCLESTIEVSNRLQDLPKINRSLIFFFFDLDCESNDQIEFCTNSPLSKSGEPKITSFFLD